MVSVRYMWRYVFWNINRIAIKAYIWPLFKVSVRYLNGALPRPPFIVVANHGTFFDPWIIGALFVHPMSIMMNDFGFKASPFIRWYQKETGAFPKKKGTHDFRALKYGLMELKRGYSLLIFPEGQVTWDGETQPLFHGIEKIIKRVNVPIVMVNIKGSFLCKPWWASTYRKGSVQLSIRTMNTEELMNKSKSEILKKLTKYLYNNDIKNHSNKNIKIVGSSLAKGLENFFWICPVCLQEDQLITDDDMISCTYCKNSWVMNPYCQIKSIAGNLINVGDLYDWSQWYKEKVKKIIMQSKNSDVITHSKNVDYCDIKKNGVVNVRNHGSLVLTKKTLYFKNDIDGSIILELNVDEIISCVFQRKEFIEVRIEGKKYMFRFLSHSTMKWVYYLRYLMHYEVYEERKYI